MVDTTKDSGEGSSDRGEKHNELAPRGDEKEESQTPESILGRQTSEAAIQVLVEVGLLDEKDVKKSVTGNDLQQERKEIEPPVDLSNVKRDAKQETGGRSTFISSEKRSEQKSPISSKTTTSATQDIVRDILERAESDAVMPILDLERQEGRSLTTTVPGAVRITSTRTPNNLGREDSFEDVSRNVPNSNDNENNQSVGSNNNNNVKERDGEEHLIQAELVVPNNNHATQQQMKEHQNDVSNNKVLVAVAEPAPKFETKWKVALLVISLALVAIVIIVVILVVTNESTLLPPIDNTETANSATPAMPINEGSPSLAPTKLPNEAVTQIGNTIIGSAPLDRFGAPLAMSADGNIVAVGARNNGDVGFESGIVRVYQKTTRMSDTNVTTTSWRLLGQAIQGLAEGDQFAFSGMAMTSTPNITRIAIGAPFHNVTTTIPTRLDYAGHVRIFDLTAVGNDRFTWTPVGILDGISSGDLFGRAVAMSSDGSIIAAAAYESSENGFASGHVRVFAAQTTTNDNNISWEQMGQTLIGHGALDRLGRAIALSSDGHRMVVGATQLKKDLDNTTTSTAGYVQVYHYNGFSWNIVGQEFIYGQADQDVFGRDVAISKNGSIIACGGNLNDGPQGNVKSAGMAQMYRLEQDDEFTTTMVWKRLGQTIYGQLEEDGLGLSLALSADGYRVAIGASQKKTGVGFVRILDYNADEGQWLVAMEDLRGANLLDKFGTDVQLSNDGTILAVGAIGSDANGDDSGQVQVCDLNPIRDLG